MIALTVEPEHPAPESEAVAPPERGRGEPDLSVLEDRAPEWAKLSRRTAILTAICCFLFLACSYQPLWHTDVWGHLSYGRWIWQHEVLPQTEPLLPLCEGVPFVDTAWLSQLIGYGMNQAFGTAGLQFLFAATIVACCVMIGGAVLRRTGSLAWAIVAVATFTVVDYQQLIIARPQHAGLVCFVVTLMLLTAETWSKWTWIGLPVLFAAWANLHGSFPMGLLLIACFAAGRAFDVYRRTGQFVAVIKDTNVRRYVLAFQLAAIATLLNPYGLRIDLEILKISGNRNLQDLVDWDALTLRMMQGKTAAAAVLALIIAYRLSPRRVSTANALALAVFGCGALWSSRIIVWWAPLVAYELALHGAAITARIRDRVPAAKPSGLCSVASVGLVWIAFAYSPFGIRVLHGAPPTAEAAALRFRHSVSPQTPIDATAYLQANPPKGLVFNTYEWGDYLLWAGPEGAQWFVASHAHLIPREVWEDYLRIASASPEWDRKLDRYGVNTIVIDQAGRHDLIRLLKEAGSHWTLDYEDRTAAIFVRKKPI
jgi:hypothetical protein